jgi:ATP-dependent protease ClpP protease subunit
MRLLRILVVVLSSFLVCCVHAKLHVAALLPPPPPVVVATPAEPEFKVARFAFDTGIDADLTKKLDEAFDTAEADGSKGMVIVINSGGGLVNEAREMAKRIDASKIPVYCIVDGTAASAAFWLLQHCPTRIMVDSSVLMAHDPYDVVFGRTNLTRKFLREHLESHDRDALEWGKESVARLKISLKFYQKKVFEKDWWIASSLAQDIGAVDRVVDDTDETVAAITEELKSRSSTCFVPPLILWKLPTP